MKIIANKDPGTPSALDRKSIISEYSETIPSSFTVTQEVPEGLLMLSTYTGELILLENGEYPRDVLLEKNFIIPEGLDEHSACIRARETMRFYSEMKVSGYRTYTILPTTDCNARCFYCYEAGCEKMHMDRKTADEVCSFILRTRASDKIDLRWFGGEPLLGADTISYICRSLASEGVRYSSSMISNGFLFDDAMIKTASEVWKLKEVQITLDGTENVYNLRKAFITQNDRAYRIVTGNISRLLDAGINVKVRLNVDENNYSDLSDLIDELSVTFGGRPGFMVYLSPIYDIKNNPSGSDQGERRRSDLFRHIFELDDKLSRLGLDGTSTSFKGLALYHCMADDPAKAAILPDGRLHACEHFNETPCFGNIREDSDKSISRGYWLEQYPEDDECISCPLFPHCFRMKNCPGSPPYCVPEIRELRIKHLRKKMLRAYELYKKDLP